MIKVFAAIFMLIDHIGSTFFPNNIVFPILGRLSMPMFAYCVARGCYYTDLKGMWKRYLKNLGIFSLIAQIPFTMLFFYCLKHSFQLNIGFTWVLAAALLYVLMGSYSIANKAIKGMVILAIGLILPVEYGIYGVLCPVVFYYFMVKNFKPLYIFAGSAFLYLLYMVMDGIAIQIFSLASVPILLLLTRYDDLVRLHKKFFYIFYPLHIMILLLVKSIVLILQYT